MRIGEIESPKTPAEWQAAVDTARVLLLLQSAKCSGRISGGPRVDVERCLEWLELGQARGFEPTEEVPRWLTETLSSKEGREGRCAGWDEEGLV